MGRITVTEQIAAPVEAVFAYVDDHLNTTKYMKGLTKWAPVGSKSHGKGAQFAVAMKAGPMTLSSVVDITTWTQNRTIAWTSREGFKQTGRWSFAPSGEAATAATFDMEYELPGGIAGRMVARAADPVVHGNIEHSVRALKQQVERAGRMAAKGSVAKAGAKPATRTSAKAATKPAAKRR